MDTPVLHAILTMLDDAGVSYKHLEHEPTRTSEESARVRGMPQRVGGKALLIKAGADRFVLVIVSAALQLKSSKLRKALGEHHLRFATVEELKDLTGLVPGSVPPFGEPILPFPLYVDKTVLANDLIAFNAGSLTHSVILDIEDYKRLVTIEAIVDVGKAPA
ncbi:MAG: YbaK/EbsC family protein [Phycisphaerales bacterium JB038]